jgi:hypothetical protein
VQEQRFFNLRRFRLIQTHELVKHKNVGGNSLLELQCPTNVRVHHHHYQKKKLPPGMKKITDPLALKIWDDQLVRLQAHKRSRE